MRILANRGVSFEIIILHALIVKSVSKDNVLLER